MGLRAIFFIGLLFFQLNVFAKSTSLQKTLNKYSKAKNIQTEIKKIDEKIVLGTKVESTGVLKYEKNKIFISQGGEKKVELYYKDKVLTLVEYPDTDFEKDGKRKVTTIKKAIPPLVKSLLNLFSNPASFNKEFEILSEKKIENDLVSIDLKSKQKNLKDFSLKINSKLSEIVELSFTDDVNTKTTIQFNKSKFGEKLNKKIFQFTKEKNDEVMFE